MNRQTRLYTWIQSYFLLIQKRFFFFQQNFSLTIFCLFFGFLVGTLFGTFLPFLRCFLPWDGLIILILIFLIETLNYNIYQTSYPSFSMKDVSKASRKKKSPNELSPRSRSFYRLQVLENTPKQEKKSRRRRFLFFFVPIWIFGKEKPEVFLKSLNFFKIGLLLGFFIDAFKVGS